MLGSVRQQQSRLAKLRGELHKANRGMNRAPGEGGRDRAGGGQPGPPDQYRQQVLAGTRVLERTGDSLARAQQVFVKHQNIKHLFAEFDQRICLFYIIVKGCCRNGRCGRGHHRRPWHSKGNPGKNKKQVELLKISQ